MKTVAQFKLKEEIKEQTAAFLKGFHEILPAKSLLTLSDRDLGLILAGVKKVDRKEEEVASEGS